MPATPDKEPDLPANRYAENARLVACWLRDRHGSYRKAGAVIGVPCRTLHRWCQGTRVPPLSEFAALSWLDERVLMFGSEADLRAAVAALEEKA